MRCSHCGFEQEQEFSFCPQCGTPKQASVVPQTSAAQKILSVLKDPLFLVICILMSASCALSLIMNNVPLLNILITVFLWLTYAQSNKDIADAKHLRCVSGVVYAEYVINYVSAGLVLLVGIIFSVAFGALAGTPAFLNTLLSGFVDAESLVTVSGIVATVSGSVLFVICAIISAVMVVINFFSLRYIHQFVKSVYQSLESGTLELRAVRKAQIWLFIIGGLSGISALSSLSDGHFLAGLSSGTGCAAAIVAGLMIHRYFSEETVAF